MIEILLVGLGGGLLPLLGQWNDRRLHIALALSTGIFLGAVFLHMLPELPEAIADADINSRALWAVTLTGVLTIYFLESLVFRTHDHDDLHRHTAVGYASLVGLSVHSLTVGLSLSTTELTTPILVGILFHKTFESFSLTSVFQLAHFSRKKIISLIILFSCITPLGIFLGSKILPQLSPQATAIAVALAIGTFLYVSLSELLPEVFHHKEDVLAKVFLLLAGIGGMAIIHD
ncbi:MAG: ZIP family metal transporter [Planctomycetota bacterium]|jgi:zinc transporter ZupT|nr:ZIP family metal transporter [Planctomycetota bacterium]